MNVSHLGADLDPALHQFVAERLVDLQVPSLSSPNLLLESKIDSIAQLVGGERSGQEKVCRNRVRLISQLSGSVMAIGRVRVRADPKEILNRDRGIKRQLVPIGKRISPFERKSRVIPGGAVKAYLVFDPDFKTMRQANVDFLRQATPEFLMR